MLLGGRNGGQGSRAVPGQSLCGCKLAMLEGRVVGRNMASEGAEAQVCRRTSGRVSGCGFTLIQLPRNHCLQYHCSENPSYWISPGQADH